MSTASLFRLLNFLGILVSLVISYEAIQCNVGLKLYSIESGRAVCATFANYGCIESCEWNTTCSKASHYIAFKGRRTYVTGMILTNDNFLLQCCSSLSTIVQMNSRREAVCVWTSWANSVEEGGSIRMDPPLSKSEYIRDILLERVEDTGKVKVKLEICKFLTQRTNCNREKMAVEERHQYSLLLLRLYRTQTLLNSTATLSKSATEAINADGIRPGSAAFSVVSRVDEHREVGNLISGVAGGESSAEEKFARINSALQHLQPFSMPTSTVLPSPELDAAFWDNQSGIPKTHTQVPDLAPPGMTPPSSFNFDIIPASAAASQVSPSAPLQRPMHSGTRRRLATNATREFVTRYTKVKDDPSLQKGQQEYQHETPFKHLLQIKKLESQKHAGTVRIPSSATPAPSSAIFVTQPTTTSAFAIPLNPGYWRTGGNSHHPAPALPRQLRPSQPSPVEGLLVCCQAQAPGCRSLCSKDVSKDEIKRALFQQCPPLSMTSVISCFPQFYDTSSVGVCCSQSPNLPQQCQALCQPNFKPTLSHLVCIDHISTIVECYRDLIR